MSKRVLSEEHPDTFTRLASLPSTDKLHDSIDAAIALMTQVASLRSSVLGRSRN